MKKITHEEFSKEVEVESKRLVSWLKKTESPSDACEQLILSILFDVGLNHYETIGIFEELKLRYREVSMQVLEECFEDGQKD